jgi:glycosyltransferase involved in cell wall biosynthesis
MSCDLINIPKTNTFTAKPRVSIGLPVFNGQKYLKETVDSVLTQTYSDFELIISDNCSTDATPQICLDYQARDSRIRYYRSARNMGAAWNFNKVFALSSGEYFKWTADDDVYAPQFLEKCVRILERDPSTVLCYAKTNIIDQDGVIVGFHDYETTHAHYMGNLSSRKSYMRFGGLLSLLYPMQAIFGVIRRSALEKTHLTGNYIGADRNLLAEIGSTGRFHEIPKYLFSYREHPRAYRNVSPWWQPNCEALSKWWDPTRTQKIIYTYNLLEYFRSLEYVQLSRLERALCYAQIINWFAREGWLLLLMDTKMSLPPSLGRKLNQVVRILGSKI